MTALAFPAEPLEALEAAIDRGCEVVDPALVAVVTATIEATLMGAPRPEPVDEAQRDVLALVEQMLIDVAGLDDATVQRADRHFAPGQLSDLVTTSYAIEARTRLRLAATRLGSRATAAEHPRESR